MFALQLDDRSVRRFGARWFTVVCLLTWVALPGCGLPTWSELIGQRPEAPANQNALPMPVVTPTPVQPTPPPPPNSKEVIAKFQQLKPYEVDDSNLQQLAALPDGLEAITELDLSGSRVSNGGLTHLTKLASLKKLDLRNSPVDKDGAPQLAKLTGLESLSLDGGEMPDEAIEQLRPLHGLRSLTLAGVRLTPVGWRSLAHHELLDELNISNSNADDLAMSIVGELRHLKRLELRNTAVTDQGMARLVNLDDATWLDLGNTRIQGHSFASIAKAKGLKSLEWLNMDGTPLDEIGARAISTMGQVKHLSLAGLSTMPDKYFVAMAKPMKGLRSVVVHKCTSLTSAAAMAFAGSDDIELINMSYCQLVDDQVFKHLQKCKSIKSLDLTGTRCSYAAAQAFKAQHPDVQIMGL